MGLLDADAQRQLLELFGDSIKLVIGMASMWVFGRTQKMRRDVRAAHEKIRAIELRSDGSSVLKTAGAPAPAVTPLLADSARVEADVSDAVRVELTLRVLPATAKAPGGETPRDEREDDGEGKGAA